MSAEHDYGPKWSYKHTPTPLSNPPVDNPQPIEWIPIKDYTPELDPLTNERIEKIIQRTLRKVFCAEPDTGAIDPRRFARVTFGTDQGEIWRGMLYPVERAE